jgi:hypothetical protein
MIEDNKNTTLPVTPKPEDTPKIDNKEEKPKKEKKSFFKYVRKRWRGLIILLLILICGAMYGWKELTKWSLKEKYREDSTRIVNKAREDSLMITAKTMSLLNANDYTYLRMITMAFGWAVQGEITRANIAKADQYVAAMVKQPNFVNILIADNDGKVVVSSNKKYESTNLSDFFAYNYINLTDNTVIKHPEDKDLFIGLSPIMNGNTKIGTLLFTFKASKITL